MRDKIRYSNDCVMFLTIHKLHNNPEQIIRSLILEECHSWFCCVGVNYDVCHMFTLHVYTDRI